MKGVVVQIGQPKSIVLLNNGRIMAIATPQACHVGMVVTVKSSGLLKTIIVIAAAVFLLSLGVIIGARFFGSSAASNEPGESEPGYERVWPDRPRHGRGHMRRFSPQEL